jgi:hypothetical protein
MQPENILGKLHCATVLPLERAPLASLLLSLLMLMLLVFIYQVIDSSVPNPIVELPVADPKRVDSSAPCLAPLPVPKLVFIAKFHKS